jgi:hypothetical protein
MDAKELTVKEGSIQGATFITADPDRRATSLEVMMLGLAGAKMALGTRRAENYFLVIRFTTKWMYGMV